MKYCIECGAQLDDNAKFCDNCTYPCETLEQKKSCCINCGMQIGADNEVCPVCGTSLQEDSENQPCCKSEEPIKKSNKGLCNLLGIINIVLWIIVMMKFFRVIAKEGTSFMDYFNMYNPSNPISAFIFWGVALWVIICGIMGIIAAMSNRKDWDDRAVGGSISIIIILLVLTGIVWELKDNFMDSVQNLLIYFVANRYVSYIKKSTYLILGIIIVLIKKKQIVGKY